MFSDHRSTVPSNIASTGEARRIPASRVVVRVPALPPRLGRASQLRFRGPMSLQGSSVLVTGGTRGIGLAIAHRLVRDGASRAVLGYLRNDDAAASAAKEIEAAGAEVVLVRGNV